MSSFANAFITTSFSFEGLTYEGGNSLQLSKYL